MNTNVYGIFYGGANYSVPSVHDDKDVEIFSGVSAVVKTLRSRVAGQDWSRPNVDDTAEFHIWHADPRAAANGGQAAEYPARRVFVGPRGGIQVERV